MFDVIEESSPMLIGLDYDKAADTSSLQAPARWRVRLHEEVYEFALCIKRDEDGNLRRFVEFVATPTSLCCSMLSSSTRRRQGAVLESESNARRFARKLHGWSHYSLPQMQLLSKRAGILTPELDEELQTVVAQCDVCPLTGSNIGSAGLRKVSLTKVIHPEANRCIELDHVSHVVTMKPRVREVVCLAMVCQGSGYGETPPVTTKSLPVAVASLEQFWVLRHGAPAILTSDPGLAGGVMSAFCKEHSITWQTRPPRRHNTIGVVERRNGVMRMVLERIVRGNDSLPAEEKKSDGILIERSNFLCNLFLGDVRLSAFEHFRGYQPSLVGLPVTFVSEMDVDAHIQLTTTRALSRMLRAKNFNPYVKPILKEGDLIYVHTRNRPGSARGSVGWARHKVFRLDPTFVCTRPVGREKGKMNKTSYADVRVPPSSPLAQAAFEFALHQPLDELKTTASNPDDAAAGEQPGLAQALENVNVEPEGTDDALMSRIDHAALTRESTGVGYPEKDIGEVTVQDPDESSLARGTFQIHCQRILDTIGRANVTRSKLAFVPAWFLDKALEDELQGWDEYIQLKPLSGVAKGTVIGSHVLYCVKTRENGEHYLKSRLVLHGNQERDKETLRSDASSLHFSLLRLILSLSVCFGFALGGIDVSKAYHQSGSPPRDVHVRPPAECMMPRCVWLLLSLPYGLVDAGRQWQLDMECWLLDTLKFTSFSGLPQVFAKLDDSGAILLLLGKISDDIIVAGKEEDINVFFAALHQRWTIGKALIADDLLFNGARILRDAATGTVSLSMNEYVREKVHTLDLSRERRKQQEERASEEEASAYRAVAGTLNFLGTGTVPVASFVASVFLQKQANLRVYDLDVANKMINEIMKLDCTVTFLRPPVKDPSVRLLGFSDASFNILGGTAYGQSGFICGLLLESHGSLIFHAIDWFSAKQRRVVYSSFGAEILACADADNRLFGLKMGLSTLLDESVISELLVDSKGLYTCITTLSDQKEYRLRRTVARIRESFDSEDLDVMTWIRGPANLADAPTKWNPESWSLLMRVLTTGLLPASTLHAESRGDTPSWRRSLPEASSRVGHDASYL